MQKIVLPPISDGSIRRAEEAEGNGRRCLVENCPRQRAVQCTHVLPREIIRTGGGLMAYLEENWGYRRGTFNLDTRKNIFFLGESLRSMFIDRLWGLLPEESVIDQYFNSIGLAKRGKYFASITPQEPTYTYTFVPIRSMEGVGITRQIENPPTDESSFTIHVYPFSTLPKLTSHIDPKFAIYHLGRALEHPRLSREVFDKLVSERPILNQVLDLYRSWEGAPSSVLNPRKADSDDSSTSSNEIDIEESDGDSVCTVPRRLAFPVKETRQRPVANQQTQSKDHPTAPLTRKKLRRAQGGPVEETSSWTNEAVSKWVEECSTSSPLDNSSGVDKGKPKEKPEQSL